MLRMVILACLGIGLFRAPIYGQNEMIDLVKHRWKDRVILICSSDTTSAAFQKQMNDFKQNETGLIERKLQTYIIQPKAYSLLGGQIKQSNNPWMKYNKRGKPFLFQLIGLDGGRKLMKEMPVSKDELFAIIDGMPMRRAELRKQH